MFFFLRLTIIFKNWYQLRNYKHMYVCKYIYIYVLIWIVNLRSDDGKLPNHRYMLFRVQGSFPEKKCGFTMVNVAIQHIPSWKLTYPQHIPVKRRFWRWYFVGYVGSPWSSYGFFQARRETNHLSYTAESWWVIVVWIWVFSMDVFPLLLFEVTVIW